MFLIVGRESCRGEGRRRGRLIAGAGLATLSAIATAQTLSNPFLGKDQFPQYREISGLSGGGYGIDFDGRGSLTGATAFSTPLGYTLGHDELRVGGNDTSFRSDRFSLRFKNTLDATGKAFVTYGHTFGSLGVTYTYFIKSYSGDSSTNFQFAYVPKSDKSPGFSIGVQDIRGKGGSAGEGIPGDDDSSQSFFFAGTYKVPLEDERPLYVSLGLGTRRFKKGFASASYHVGGSLRVYTEHDGFGFNEGVLLTSRTSSIEANLQLGLIKSKYPTASLTLGFALPWARRQTPDDSE